MKYETSFAPKISPAYSLQDYCNFPAQVGPVPTHGQGNHSPFNSIADVLSWRQRGTTSISYREVPDMHPSLQFQQVVRHKNVKYSQHDGITNSYS
jgi:hypothetical protein